MLVSRLDGPTAAIVRRMISDAIETEKDRTLGPRLCRRRAQLQGGLADGDEWLQTVVKDLRRVGIPVVYDQKPATFSVRLPDERLRALLWLVRGRHVGSVHADRGFAFTPGAIAVHIHSFSASTLRHGGRALGRAAPEQRRGGVVRQRLRAVSANDGASRYPQRPAAPRIHSCGERLHGDARAFLDDGGGGRPALPALRVLVANRFETRRRKQERLAGCITISRPRTRRTSRRNI